MLGSTWNHSLIRKHIIIFGSLFTDIFVNRVNTDGSPAQTIQNPVSYGPKEKFLARLLADPNLSRQAVVLPRIGFEITNIAYASDRKTNSMNKSVAVNTSDYNKANFLYAPVPYDFTMSLYVMTKNVDDGTQIVEQIMPMFTPEWTVRATLIPSLNIIHDIPVVLQTVAPLDTYDQNYQSRRVVMWTMQFVMRGYLYGPIRSGALVKKTIINFIADANGSPWETYTVQPGLTANGQPTSNAALTVPLSQIAANSNYGFIEDLTNDV